MATMYNEEITQYHVMQQKKMIKSSIFSDRKICNENTYHVILNAQLISESSQRLTEKSIEDCNFSSKAGNAWYHENCKVTHFPTIIFHGQRCYVLNKKTKLTALTLGVVCILVFFV